MDNKINIDLSDVKCFLQTLNYTWNGKVKLNNSIQQVTSFDDLDGNRDVLTSLILLEDDARVCKDVVITETSFVFYQQTLDLMDIDATFEYEVEIDYTEQWVRFLAHEYGKQYKDYVKQLCKKMRQLEVNKAKHEFDKIKEIKSEIIRKLKTKLCHLQKLEDIVDNVEELKK